MKLRYLIIYIMLFAGFSVTATASLRNLTREKKDAVLAADPVGVNRLLSDLAEDWENISALRMKPEETAQKYDLDFAVLDGEGSLLLYTDESVSTTISQATRHGDVIRDIEVDNAVVGKLLVYNRYYDKIDCRNRRVGFWFAVMCGLNGLVIVLYTLYIYRVVIKPFRRMEHFAGSVAAGNLDVRLERDKHNVFGAFTESFDIMREELIRAREKEAEAKNSQKELVAELSHDIKTPVASIKAMTEVMQLTAGKQEQETLHAIIKKTDQIDDLVTNLFHATLEELEELSVNVEELDSRQIAAYIKESDFQSRVGAFSIPDCVILGDGLRVEQVIGNILTNSYKYADTEIEVKAQIVPSDRGRTLAISFRDFGQGVTEEELPLLTQKFARGSNAKGQKGSGLGLYISGYLCEKMRGGLVCENAEPGFCVTITFMLA